MFNTTMTAQALTPQVFKLCVEQVLMRAGLAGIFKYADPRAAAVAALVAEISRPILRDAYRAVFAPGVAEVVALGVSMLVASKAGQRVDERFSYLQMCISEAGLAATVVSVAVVGAASLGMLRIAFFK